MHLLNYIEKFYAGNQAAFARHAEVSSQQVTNLIATNYHIDDCSLESVKLKLPAVKTVFVYLTPNKNNFPLYEFNWREQRTYRGAIELDISTGDICLAYYENWNSPPECYFGIFRRYEIHAGLNAADICKLIDENIHLFQAVQTGSELVYDGRNWRGELNNDALSVERKLARQLYIDTFFDEDDDDYFQQIQRYDYNYERELEAARHR
jgi:hypothetical protein